MQVDFMSNNQSPLNYTINIWFSINSYLYFMNYSKILDQIK